jgi:release factor glutamine methyltransferase
MRPAEVARRGADYLARHGVESPEGSAELLLMRVLDVSRADLFAREQGPSTAEARAFGRALCRRCTGTPLQHLTGEEGFRHLTLSVRPGVFVPRPETEVLVEVALDRLEGLTAPLVADVGTGTGAIALAIADEHPGATVWASDVAPEAVALARANADRLGLSVRVVEGDLLEALPAELRGRLDLVTANPPYVPIERRDELPAEVLADPELALFGGPPIYARLFAGALAWLRPGGCVVVEIEESTADVVTALARDAGLVDPSVRPDLSGRDRVVAARRP